MLRKILYISAIFAALSCRPASGIHIGKAEGGKLPPPYSLNMSHPLDQPVNAACQDGSFLMNLGPTGIRAIIMPDAPKVFKVKFVFQDAQSPAKGLISPGDHIIGANGKAFNNPHGFHRKRSGSRGWQGPPFELAHAIEDSQGSDGKLSLIVLKGGKQNSREIVTLQIEPVGRFSATYPWNCPRSDKLLQDLCDFMIDNGIDGRLHKRIQMLLALWAADEKRIMPQVESMAESLMKRRASFKAKGMTTWSWGYQGIFLGEYYNMTKDRDVKPAAEALTEAYELGQAASGGYSHRPEPFIQYRAMTTGKKGYGAMASPGGLAMLAQSLFKATGLPYSEKAYMRTHIGYLRSAGESANGAVGYGFSNGRRITDHAILVLEGKNPLAKPEGGSAAKDSDGNISYDAFIAQYVARANGPELSQTGMQNLGKYKVRWPHPKDHRWRKGCIDWLKDEASKNKVYWKSENQVRVLRSVSPPQTPTGPYKTKPGGGGHPAAEGMGAVAHLVGNQGNQPWNWLGEHMATCCATSPRMMWDGHAEAVMHAFFSVLGAARADEKDFRSYLDYAKTWIILSETHEPTSEGGLVEQPFGCQRNSTCSITRDRRQYTHVAILLLSIPKRKLLITGADYAQPAGAGHASKTSGRPPLPWEWKPPAPEPEPALRAARTLSEERRAALDRALLSTLVKLSEAGALGAFPLKISLTTAGVVLTNVAADGTLTFSPVAGTQSADIKISELKPIDRATLALLVSQIKPESTDAKAMTGVYMESLGKVKEADALFEEAGDASRAKLETLFD